MSRICRWDPAGTLPPLLPGPGTGGVGSRAGPGGAALIEQANPDQREGFVMHGQAFRGVLVPDGDWLVPTRDIRLVHKGTVFRRVSKEPWNRDRVRPEQPELPIQIRKEKEKKA